MRKKVHFRQLTFSLSQVLPIVSLYCMLTTFIRRSDHHFIYSFNLSVCIHEWRRAFIVFFELQKIFREVIFYWSFGILRLLEFQICGKFFFSRYSHFPPVHHVKLNKSSINKLQSLFYSLSIPHKNLKLSSLSCLRNHLQHKIGCLFS